MVKRLKASTNIIKFYCCFFGLVVLYVNRNRTFMVIASIHCLTNSLPIHVPIRETLAKFDQGNYLRSQYAKSMVEQYTQRSFAIGLNLKVCGSIIKQNKRPCC